MNRTEEVRRTIRLGLKAWVHKNIGPRVKVRNMRGHEYRDLGITVRADERKNSIYVLWSRDKNKDRIFIYAQVTYTDEEDDRDRAIFNAEVYDNLSSYDESPVENPIMLFCVHKEGKNNIRVFASYIESVSKELNKKKSRFVRYRHYDTLVVEVFHDYLGWSQQLFSRKKCKLIADGRADNTNRTNKANDTKSKPLLKLKSKAVVSHYSNWDELRRTYGIIDSVISDNPQMSTLQKKMSKITELIAGRKGRIKIGIGSNGRISVTILENNK